ncbi:putative glutamate-1-semialdehyde 2,1-aminomutase [Microthyrium microscopicum]|uniref:Putative glutamate-1-semialdehyde 2,1-aminomutase n=1 Tax=Microthyrium microscopicum TaxID=703497 RepID=A0A6A6U7T4_9PEZI|nr:putative glutamate-1-semialdehyde 2,1-aminomutase [Microthyrium microscopicum]
MDKGLKLPIIKPENNGQADKIQPPLSALQTTLESMQRRYANRNPKSLAFYNETLKHMPGANTRTVLHALPFPLTISHGQSTTLFSVDGHSYIDFLSEYSAGIYGHSNATIKAAIVKALDGGWNFGGKNQYEGELAKILVERFGNGMDMIRFCNSGTEANLMAIGAAIGFTGKQKILAFIGGYHGGPLSFPEASPKYSMNAKYDFILAPYNDIKATKAILSGLPPDSLAAILVEGMQGAGGSIPGQLDFLHYLRMAATDYEALFILDEVMTSRLAYRGLQSTLGISPDITTLGKWIGGGMGIGAFGGRREIMEMFDPRNGKLTHSGTFNNNVVTMAAGIAGCKIMDEDTVEKLNALGERLRNFIDTSIEKLLGAAATPKMYTTGLGSLFNITFAGPEKDVLHAVFYHYLLEHGIYIATRGFITMNIEHTEEHVETFGKVIEGFLAEYRDALV